MSAEWKKISGIRRHCSDAGNLTPLTAMNDIHERHVYSDAYATLPRMNFYKTSAKKIAHFASGKCSFRGFRVTFKKRAYILVMVMEHVSVSHGSVLVNSTLEHICMPQT